MKETDYKKAFEELQVNLEELTEWAKKDTSRSSEWKQGYVHIAKQVIDVCKRTLGTATPPAPVAKPAPIAKVIAFRKHTYKAD
jgi:hypothetical protein